VRQRLDQLLVVASGRADRNPQGDRPQNQVQRARRRAEKENAGGQNQQRVAFSASAFRGRFGPVR